MESESLYCNPFNLRCSPPRWRSGHQQEAVALSIGYAGPVTAKVCSTLLSGSRTTYCFKMGSGRCMAQTSCGWVSCEMGGSFLLQPLMCLRGSWLWWCYAGTAPTSIGSGALRGAEARALPPDTANATGRNVASLAANALWQKSLKITQNHSFG